MTAFVITGISLLFVLFHSAEAQQISTACDVQCFYKEDLQEANCDSRLLNSIPIECSQSIHLSLRDNLITEIKPGVFRYFLSLKILILSRNNIYQIHANAFNGAYQLKYIKLLYNNLHTISRDALNGTENLRSIDLGRNYLSAIEDGTFQLALQLELIDLSWNHLTYLSPAVFRHLKNLKRLYLGKNKLVDLSEDIFKDQSSLIYLDLSNNLLSSLPFKLFTNLVKLHTLDLSANRLMVFTFTLPNIHVLKLHNNELKHLSSASLENWTSVGERLYLEGNPWACNCSFEAFGSGCLRVSPYCNITDTPVCASPPDLVNQSLKNLKQTCPLQKIVSTPKVNKNELPHLHDQYSYVILVLPIGCLLFMVIIYRGCRNGQTIHVLLPLRGYSPWRPSAVMGTTRGESPNTSPGLSRTSRSSNQPTGIATPTKRPRDRTPIKCPSQNPPNPPAPPSKNIDNSGDGIEKERNGCRRNLFDDFV
eukprot:XP_011677845.1 PREDICTED: leucine-rich repeat-containing protein 15-like [Strongylocentrotus purpuratus]